MVTVMKKYNFAFFCSKELVSFFKIHFKKLLSCNVIFVYSCNSNQLDVNEYNFQLNKDNNYEFLDKFKVEFCLVYGWDYLIPESVLNKYDFYNMHPSLLPKYRGPLPVLYQMLNKESILGITLHKMDRYFDSGDVYKQISFEVEEELDYLAVVMKILRLAIQLVYSFIEDYAKQTVVLVPQDNSQSTYYSKRDLDRYIIDSTFTYQEFYRLGCIFKDYFPFRVRIGSKIYVIKSFSLEPGECTQKFELVDQVVYLRLDTDS